MCKAIALMAMAEKNGLGGTNSQKIMELGVLMPLSRARAVALYLSYDMV